MTRRAFVDLNSNVFTLDGRPSRELRPRSAEVIFALCEAWPGPLTLDGLYRALFGKRAVDASCLAMHVSNARKQLRLMGADVESVRGIGYLLLLPPDPNPSNGA
jgi:DNA-binding response OmpR family regulator